MRTFVVYKDLSEHGQPVREFLRDFMHQTGKQLEVVDPDTRDGDALCQTYDVVEYPSIVALDDNGVLQNVWRGLPLPTISEISYYVR